MGNEELVIEQTPNTQPQTLNPKHPTLKSIYGIASLR